MRRGATNDRKGLRRRCAGLWVGALVLAALVTAGGSSGDARRLDIVVEANMTPVITDEIYRLDLDGRRTNLSRSLTPDGDAHISPDGRRVAFTRATSASSAGVQAELVALGGGALRSLAAREHTIALGPWSPRGDAILATIVTAAGARPQLAILAPGRRPQVLLTAPAGYDLGDPVWSPDASEVAVHVSRVNDSEEITDGVVHVVRASGGTVFRTREFYWPFGWSARGRLAVVDPPSVNVFDSGGRLVTSFAGEWFAWSRDGQLLATLQRDTIEVRNRGGAGAIVASAPALNCQETLTWLDATHVACQTTVLDVRSGHATRTPKRRWYLATCECVSPDGTHVAEIVPRGHRFAIRVTRRNGTRGRFLATLPACVGIDLEPDPGLNWLRFAANGTLVYGTHCAIPAHLYLATPDGSTRRRVTSAAGYDSEPVSSPDSTRIAYVHHEPSGGVLCVECPESLWVMNADGSNAHKVAPIQLDSVVEWSPDSRRLLFTLGTDDNRDDVWTIAPADGGASHPLPFTFDAPVAPPIWTPTGFAYYSEGARGIFTVRRDGTGARKVSPLGDYVDVFDLAAAPDGRVAWTEDNLSETIKMLAADGKTVRTVARIPFSASVTFVGWSHSGRLAWLQTEEGAKMQTTLWVLEDAGPQRIRLPFASVGTVRWSHDGSAFVIVGVRADGLSDVYWLTADGSRVSRVTTGIGARSADSTR